MTRRKVDLPNGLAEKEISLEISQNYRGEIRKKFSYTRETPSMQIVAIVHGPWENLSSNLFPSGGVAE